MKQHDVLKILKSDITGAEPYKVEQDKKIEEWLKARNGEPYGNEEDNKSAIISRDIRKQEEWQIAGIIEPFVSNPTIVRASPVTAEDKMSAMQNELLLNKQFCRGGESFKRYRFMQKLARVLYQEGTATIKCGWDYEGEEVTEVVQNVVGVYPDGVTPIIEEQEVTYERPLRNHPTADVMKNEDVYIDPTCEEDIDKAQFVAVRYESTISELKNNPRFKDIDKIKIAKEEDSSISARDEDSFSFSDNPRKKVTVYEYWGNYDLNDDGVAEPIVCSWVGDTIIELKENPYPDKRIPFISLPFSYTPFKMYGESNAELIGDDQKTKTAIKRGMINTLAASSNGQIGIKKMALDPLNKKRFEDGKNFEFNGQPQTDIWQGNFNDLPSSTFSFYQLISNEIESITGVKSFSSGLGSSSLGNTAAAVNGTLGATAKRELDIVRNIAENAVKPLLRKWMVYNAEFLEDEEVVRVTNSEFVPVRRDDLAGLIDLDIQISTAETDNMKAQELAFMLQTLGPSATPEERRMIQADIARLRKMPDLAAKIEAFEPPPPDPLAQRMMELEVALKEAEVQERMSRAQENQVDMRLKTANAVLAEAQARSVHSKTDLDDLDFLEKQKGLPHQREMEKQVVKTQAKMAEQDNQTVNDIRKQLGA